MSDLGMSFAGLVKNNNGMFKTPKQAAFLLSQCDSMVYLVCGSSGWAGYQLYYKCDADGVVEVIKYTQAKGDTLQWQRVVEGKTSVQDRKEFKRLMRLRNALEKKIAEREVAYAAGDFTKYSYGQALYDEAIKQDTKGLANIDTLLQKLPK